jgi:hypothetical protein
MPLNPPTDNLYKFMAVFGIVMVVSGFALDQKTRRDFSDALTELQVQHSHVMRELRIDGVRTKELLDRLHELGNSTPAEQKQQLEVLRQLERVSPSDRRQSEGLIRAEGRYEALKEDYVKTGLVALSLQMGGIGVAAAGFWLWYHRLQKQLDERPPGAVQG